MGINELTPCPCNHFLDSIGTQAWSIKNLPTPDAFVQFLLIVETRSQKRIACTQAKVLAKCGCGVTDPLFLKTNNYSAFNLHRLKKKCRRREIAAKKDEKGIFSLTGLTALLEVPRSWITHIRTQIVLMQQFPY